jgi:hypothetical protein
MFVFLPGAQGEIVESAPARKSAFQACVPGFTLGPSAELSASAGGTTWEEANGEHAGGVADAELI